MATKLTGLTHKIAIQLHLVSDSCTIRSSFSRCPVRKLLDTPSWYLKVFHGRFMMYVFQVIVRSHSVFIM
jgi:hypothetical protein